MTFSIIIPVYNKIEIIGKCIAINIKHCSEPQEWIVIDNASDEKTKQGLLEIQNMASDLGHVFKIITEETNTGVAKAWNKGLINATQSNICVLNNDCILMPQWDKIATAEIKKNRLSLFSPYILEPPMFKTDYGESEFLYGECNWKYYLNKNENRYRKGYFDGVVFMGSKSVFDAIGLYDEFYWLTMEDVDFQHRAMQKNFSIGKTGNIIGFHHISATRKSMNVNEERNALHFKEKFGFHFGEQDSKWINKVIRSYDKKLFRWFGKMGTIARQI